ncbi:MAG: hypothetical protein K8963_06670, partial [Proteobacteria bacterium]|nr:hypothetical protein [Pseudomonadota bacterium]
VVLEGSGRPPLPNGLTLERVMQGDGIFTCAITGTPMVTEAISPAISIFIGANNANSMTSVMVSLEILVPEILVRFPLAQSLTDSATMTPSGSIEVPDGDVTDYTLTAAVNSGAPTDVTVDGENNWSIELTLTEGIVATPAVNSIEFVLSATAAGSYTKTITITHFVEPEAPTVIPMAEPIGLVLSADGTKAYVVDVTLQGIYEVDLVTGLNKVLSVGGDSAVGTGEAFSNDLEGGIALDAANNRLLVSDDGNNNIIAVSLASGTLGNRTVFSGAGQTGPAVSAPFGMAIDAAGARAFVVDTTADGVIALALSDGNRTLISSSASPEMGSGQSLSSPRDVVWDSANSRLLVIGTVSDELVAVDITTGNRTVIGAPMGNSVDFATARGLALDSTNNLVYVAEFASFEGIASVDVEVGGSNTGTRTIVSNADTGDGLDGAPDFAGARGVVIDSANNRLLVVDSTIDAIVAVNLTNGNRSLVVPPPPSPPMLGSGGRLSAPVGVALNDDTNTLYIADDGINAVVSVDLASGNRAVVSNDATGTGTALVSPRGLGWNAQATMLFIPDNTLDGVIAVDPATGNRTTVADNDGTAINSAPAFGSPRGHIAAESNTNILVADPSRGTVFRVYLDNDPNTAATEVAGSRVALATLGTNDELDGVQSVIIDATNSRAIAVTGSASNANTLDAVVAIALADGTVTVLSNLASSAGTGDEWSDPRVAVLDADGDRLLVLDVGLNALVEVDLSTGNEGNRTVISDGDDTNDNGDGTSLADIGGASGLVFDDERQVVYVVNEELIGVLMIDLESGNQVIISQ